MSYLEENYFKLYSNCIPVKGRNNSLIYDFQKSNFFKIDNDFYDILLEIESLSLAEIRDVNLSLFEMLEKLVEEDLGFFCNNPESFPKLSEQFDLPSVISNAIIEVSNTRTVNFSSLGKSLNNLNCNFLIFKFLSPISFSKISEILEKIMINNFYVVELWLLESPKKSVLKKVASNFPQVRVIRCLNSKPSKVRIKKTTVIGYNFKDFTEFCTLSKPNFRIDYKLYCESLEFNNCLNKKVSIDSQGNVKNCLYFDKIYGNYEDIESIVKSIDFQIPWKITKDNIETCKDCEYRYACPDCRAFTVKNNLLSKPKFCNFTP